MTRIVTLANARSRRDAGIATSSSHSGAAWRKYALSFVRSYLRTNEELFVDDLWDAGLTEPVSPRALGAVIQQAARNGWMVQKRVDGDYQARPSVRSNMQLKPVWESRL